MCEGKAKAARNRLTGVGKKHGFLACGDSPTYKIKNKNNKYQVFLNTLAHPNSGLAIRQSVSHLVDAVSEERDPRKSAT